MTLKMVYAASLLLATAVMSPAAGMTNYWDNNGDSSGFGTAGGTWGLDANWSADATGASVPGVTATTEVDDLFFGTSENGLGAGTVAVDGGGQAFRTLSFGAASGTITLSGGVLTLAEPSSRVVVNNDSNVIASVLSGAGGLHKYAPPVLTYTNFLTETAAVLLTNALLSEYTYAGGVLHGGWVAKLPANVYHFANDGATATAQLQVLHDGLTKCVKIELTQAGADIEGRTVYAKNVSGSQLGYDFDSGGTESTLAASSSVNGYGVAQTVLLPVERMFAPFLTTTPAVVLTNATLAEISSVAAGMAGNSVSLGPVPAAPYFFNHNGATGTVQMQAYNGGYTKCVKIELAQAGEDVTARVLYAKYHNSQNNNLVGFDFDTGGTTMDIASSFGAGGYGLCQLRLLRTHTLTLTGANTYFGDTVSDGGVLEIGPSGQLGGGAYAGAVVVYGPFLYNSASNQVLSGNLSGSGMLVKDSPGKTENVFVYDAFLTQTAIVILPNTSLADCTGADGMLGGAFIDSGSGLPYPADAYHFVNDGTSATFQLQAYDGGHTKCVKVALAQAGTNVTGRVVYAKYLLSQNALGFDFDTGGSSQTVATSYAAGGYGAAHTVLTLLRHSTLTLSGTNTYAGGTAVNKGSLVASGSADALPSTGAIIVGDGGNLVLSVPPLNVSNPGGVGNGNPITVKSGGTLTLAGVFNSGYSRLVTLDGGTLNSVVTENNDNANYLNNLVLKNGARVVGHKVRVGYHSAASIVVGGTSPSFLEAGLNMVNMSSRALTVNVADVTGDGGADFTISGVIRDYAVQFEGMPIIKTGAGTLLLSGVNPYVGPYTVSAGTLALGAGGALNAGNGIVLNGGTLDMGAVTNAAGTLTLSADSTLLLGEGRLAFADSSATSWGEGQSLTLVGTLGKQSLRVGTSQEALTGSQLAAITFNGKPVVLTAEGYLSEPPKGTLMRVH